MGQYGNERVSIKYPLSFCDLPDQGDIEQERYINLNMAFLVKYIAFVVAFLSAAKLGESIDLKLVDASDADSVQAYADLVKKDICETFDPSNDEHMTAIGDDVATLKHLLTVYYMGDSIEICEPKEGDRILFTGPLLIAIGKAAALAALGGVVSGLVGSWFG